jgi:hypothetical protein
MHELALYMYPTGSLYGCSTLGPRWVKPWVKSFTSIAHPVLFRSQITSVVQAALTSPSQLAYDATADALGAAVLLDELDASQALQHLLTARLAAFRALLSEACDDVRGGGREGAAAEQADANGNAAEDAAVRAAVARLGAAAGLVQATVHQVGHSYTACGYLVHVL